MSFASQKIRQMASPLRNRANTRCGVGAEIVMMVVPKGFGVLETEVGLDAAQGEVHHGAAARVGVALLAVDADVAQLAAVAMGFDELF